MAASNQDDEDGKDRSDEVTVKRHRPCCSDNNRLVSARMRGVFAKGLFFFRGESVDLSLVRADHGVCSVLLETR